MMHGLTNLKHERFLEFSWIQDQNFDTQQMHTFSNGYVIYVGGGGMGETTQNSLDENLKKLYLYENLG
jgi:hypothetical protein